jgi:hypothetical protein
MTTHRRGLTTQILTQIKSAIFEDERILAEAAPTKVQTAFLPQCWVFYV